MRNVAVERNIEPMTGMRFKKRGMNWGGEPVLASSGQGRGPDSRWLDSLAAEKPPSLETSCQSPSNLGQKDDRARIDRRSTQTQPQEPISEHNPSHLSHLTLRKNPHRIEFDESQSDIIVS